MSQHLSEDAGLTLINAQHSSTPITEAAEDSWDGIKDYLQIKGRKLLNQFNNLGKKISDIFTGVSIYVNGFTEPNADELKSLIHDHGGAYCYHYTPSKVTHIITNNLPDTKVKNLSAGVIVCTPSWIVDSVTAKKVLPVSKYRLYHKETEQTSLKFGRVDKGKGSASGPTLKKAKLDVEDGNTTSSGSLVKSSSTSLPSAANLISEFYSHSRLHHLSTWSTELKEFTSKMRLQITPKLVKLPPTQSIRKDGTQIFVHIDLDCFFVSVGLRERSHLVGKPVAVSHFKNNMGGDFELGKKLPTDSMSDIASCNYQARDKGVRNGMLVGKALKQCPNLVIIPYEFEKYRSVSQTFYETLLSLTPDVESVSCDEAYMELTDYVTSVSVACDIVRKLRDDIFSKTQCHASAGIGQNMLLARLSTRKAKPCGQFYLSSSNVEEFLSSHLVSDLPGVGYSTSSKLKGLGITTCQQLAEVSISKLHMEFGKKIGTNLYNFARGIDDRCLTLEVERKSLSADVNFGIRFQNISDADEFISNLSKEVERRATESNVVGKLVTLKLKVRKPDAPIETAKYLGHGVCYNLSKSSHLPSVTCKASVLETTCNQILRQLDIPVTDIRGIGIQLNKLNSMSVETKGYGDLRKAFASYKPSTKTITNSAGACGVSSKPSLLLSSPVGSINLLDETFEIPPASQLDVSVFEALPEHYRTKISALYAKEKIETSSWIQGPSNPVSPPSTNVETAQFSDANMTTVFAYLRDWLDHSEDGPIDSDLELFSEYIVNLLATRMDTVYCMLRYLWRRIASQQLTSWEPGFVQLLSAVQAEMLKNYHVELNTDFIHNTSSIR